MSQRSTHQYTIELFLCFFKATFVKILTESRLGKGELSFHDYSEISLQPGTIPLQPFFF